MALRHFADYARSRGVKYLPCAPTTVAAFIRSESAIGVTPERIVLELRAIEQAHDSAGLPNPVACASPRMDLTRIIKTEGPRSWNKSERLVFAGLAPEVQGIILRHAKLDSDAVRRTQNEAAVLRSELKSLEKGNENAKQQEIPSE